MELCPRVQCFCGLAPLSGLGRGLSKPGVSALLPRLQLQRGKCLDAAFVGNQRVKLLTQGGATLRVNGVLGAGCRDPPGLNVCPSDLGECHC